MNVEKAEKIRMKLQKSSVGIAGAGGLGSNVAISLARAGVGRILIVDYDKVEESNLNRQYFFRDQIGQVKVDALKENIKRIDESIRVETLNHQLRTGFMHKPFNDVDVIVEALDKAETKTDFIEDIMNNLPDKVLVACSGVSGYGNIDRVCTKHIGNLHMVYDDKAKDSEEDVLMAPRIILMANWQANIVLDILLGEDK